MTMFHGWYILRRMDTEGREKLIALCGRERGMARRISETLGVVPATVSRWMRTTDPEPEYRLALERLYGIPANDWLTDEERVVAFGESGGGSAD